MYINVYFPTESPTEACHFLFTIHSLAAIAAIVILPHLASAAPALVRNDGACRALPGDEYWHQQKEWGELNRTVRGRLIRGVPLAGASCYSTNVSATSEACVTVQREWVSLALVYAWLHGNVRH
jgi:hypothetical protein